VIDGIDEMLVVLGIPHPAQQSEHSVTAGPLRLNCVGGDPVPEAAVTVVSMAM
jgi:hypothetical protein